MICARRLEALWLLMLKARCSLQVSLTSYNYEIIDVIFMKMDCQKISFEKMNKI